MNVASDPASLPWLRRPAGRRYLCELALLLAAKLALLIVLYVVFVAPQPRADTSAAAVRAHVAGAAAQPTDDADHDRR